MGPVAGLESWSANAADVDLRARVYQCCREWRNKVTRKGRSEGKPDNMAKTRRGIFCIEGEWDADLRTGLTFRPLLEVLEKCSTKTPFVHRDAATREELFYYLTKWTQRRYDEFPILYLGFHGEDGGILMGDGRRRESFISLQDLMEPLEGACHRRIIYFGSCDTMSIHGATLNHFLRVTGALALCGYSQVVDYLRSAAFELLLLNSFQHNALTVSGARAMKRRIETDARQLCREMGFRMLVKKP